jgi:hypothetical protein
MDALYQRLKELDSDTFEKLCFHLLKERHPGADVRRVEGSAGDFGADVFVGDLDSGPIIWQCKSFPNGVRNSQKGQIRQSLRRAVQHLAPSKWVLCLSVDLDIAASRWFDRLKRSYADKIDIGLMPAGQIVHELLYRSSIRNHFFPNAALDTAALRALLGKTGELSDFELQTVTEDNLEQYIERLKQRDARFTYEITISADRKPASTIAPRGDLAFSMSIDNFTVNAYPRDVEALRRDPPRFSFSLHDAGISKMHELSKTGRGQLFGQDDFSHFSTSFAFLSEGPPQTMYLGQTFLTKISVPTRIAFGIGPAAVTYNFVELTVVRVGTDEIELASSDVEAFIIAFINRGGGAGTLRLKVCFDMAEVRKIQKCLQALNALKCSGHIDVHDLREDKRLFQIETDQASSIDSLGIAPGLSPFVDDLCVLAEFYGVSLNLPRHIEDSDMEAFCLLKAFMRGEDLSSTLNTIRVSLVKSQENEHTLIQELQADVHNIELRFEDVCVILFNVPIHLGPVAYRFTTARVENIEEVGSRWVRAPIDSAVEVCFVPTGPLNIIKK